MHDCGFSSFNNLYNMIEGMRSSLIPLRASIEFSGHWLKDHRNPIHNTGLSHVMLSYLILAERLTRTYKKPAFDITECSIDKKLYRIDEKVVLSKTFCQLKHFSKVGFKQTLPKLLIVAPMAGHHATLLRETVRELLPYSDVYITDWVDASKVPNKLGSFSLDDFINYLIEFMTLLGPNVHTVAVCQPTIPLLAAISIMSEKNDPNVPNSMILMGGPIDARQSPTKVDVLALDKSMEWFHQMMTTEAPINYAGYGRDIYPGILQLIGFISLNVPRHINSHLDLLQNLLDGNIEKANHTIKFYDEYLASMDMSAEFYLETIQKVFKEFALAKDEFTSNGRKVSLKHITKCALLGIEAENDDIAAVGQTKSALEMCSGIPKSMKQYHLQEGAGHYGLFSGSKFKEFIVPVMTDFINKHDKAKKHDEPQVVKQDKAKVVTKKQAS